MVTIMRYQVIEMWDELLGDQTIINFLGKRPIFEIVTDGSQCGQEASSARREVRLELGKQFSWCEERAGATKIWGSREFGFRFGHWT